MPSTACSCIGHLAAGTWTVDLADPCCHWHGLPITETETSS